MPSPALTYSGAPPVVCWGCSRREFYLASNTVCVSPALSPLCPSMGLRVPMWKPSCPGTAQAGRGIFVRPVCTGLCTGKEYLSCLLHTSQKQAHGGCCSQHQSTGDRGSVGSRNIRLFTIKNLSLPLSNSHHFLILGLTL